METILWYIATGCLIAVIVINLALPIAGYYHTRRLVRDKRLLSIQRLYGLHYQRKSFLSWPKQ